MTLLNPQIRGLFKLAMGMTFYFEKCLFSSKKYYASYKAKQKYYLLDQIISCYDVLFMLLGLCYRFSMLFSKRHQKASIVRL
jgi:hypothetical protein